MGTRVRFYFEYVSLYKFCASGLFLRVHHSGALSYLPNRDYKITLQFFGANDKKKNKIK